MAVDAPLVLLDVDGVLNPTRRSSPRFRRFMCVLESETCRLLLDPRHGAKLRALERAAGAALVWATTWGDLANEEIGPRIGLPALPVVPLLGDPPRPAGVNVKTWHVAEYVRDRPFVWFDDDLGAADLDYLRDHPGVAEFLIVHVDHRKGLDDGHLDEALRWLSR
ncbi:HAD domain-containing protein [Microbispora sp. H10949]|uniref:HAD domain-containing protein n=1 Tax=Microbispora sp. H10949 TaxID=2729111 RepID=UPI0016011710|nr:HAD domain-containing protein [Microbispora sp. H10949]